MLLCVCGGGGVCVFVVVCLLCCCCFVCVCVLLLLFLAGNFYIFYIRPYFFSYLYSLQGVVGTFAV